MTRRFATLALVVLLVSSLPIATVAAGGTADAPSESTSSEVDAFATAQSDGVLERTLTLRHRPERPGEFGTELTVTVPDRVSALTITLDSDATVESADGFERAEAGVYEWTGSTDRPSITFVMPADWRDRRHRSTAQDGEQRSFAVTDEWGIVPVPRVRLDWRRPSASDPVALDRTVVVDGPGATGGDVAYFGAVAAEHTREVRGETIRLVVPEAAEPRESPADVLDALANASDALRVDGRNDEAFLVAAPTGDVQWAARGIQYGAGDAWVAADARLETASSPWIHEYVHTRQDFADSAIGTTAETRWLIEAQAEYHAALLALEANRIDYRAFEADMADGRQPPTGEDVLAAPSSWEDPRADYNKGQLVLGALDRRIRLETDGDRTLAHVVRRLNLRDEPVTHDAFLETVAAVGGSDARTFADRYARTADAPETWTRVEHGEAFDREMAVFAYGLSQGEVDVSGPYRDVALDDVSTVVVGETIAVPIDVENLGDRAGEYYAPLVVDGRVVNAGNGTLEAGARDVERTAWTPDAAGRYELRIGDDRLSVEVVRPADGAITALETDADRVDPNESVAVTATVTNDAEIPAERTVSIRTPDGVAHEERVRLAPGESTAVETTVRFADRGRYEIAAGERSVEVAVGTAGPVTADRLEEVPGFGVSAALLALAAVLVLASRSSRTRRSD